MADLAAIFRGAGIRVDEIGDWRHRVRPGDWAPVGVMLHHTAGTKSLPVIVDGRSDLPGPLATAHIPKDGTLNLVSAGRSNHAGRGARLVLDEVRMDVAPSGDAAARGLRDGPVGNGYFYGFECENLGDGRDPWPIEQLETVARAAAALCRHHGWTSERVVGHREWTARKPDPRGFSTFWLREWVNALLAPTVPPLSYAHDLEGRPVICFALPVTLDADGWGSAPCPLSGPTDPVPCPIGRFVSATSHGVLDRYDPATGDSRTVVASVGWRDSGGNVRIVAEGPANATVMVWVVTAA